MAGSGAGYPKWRGANSGRPTWFCSLLSSGKRRAWIRYAERVRRGEAQWWKPVWRGSQKARCPIGGKKEPGKPAGAQRGRQLPTRGASAQKGRAGATDRAAWIACLSLPQLLGKALKPGVGAQRPGGGW
ncbi:hypothetical protein NDU88_001420 [Pleurodeles waltl]|uniref:Uncharacterized protein n=1 Tax=Pleurodeles waltl TaxID=8319 RepID=A0AAV7WPA3_PLEWA|nr:hypothetical protein NDU88_001420 [Pleurodeles waltl]